MKLALFALLFSTTVLANAQEFAALEEAIANTWQPDAVQVVWVPLFGDPSIMEDWTDVKMESELPECTLGIITVTFSGTKPDGTRARATFKGRAKVYGDCWTVTDRVKPNETIAPENLLQLTCEWNGLRTSPILDRSRTAGKCAVRTLVPGRPILKSDLREKPIVQSGSPVTVVFERDGIRVKLDGIAMMDGGRGEQIPVRIPEIQKNRLTGVIHDERTLYWVP